MNYGMPYQGSKSKIANKILTVLPSGKRFVDLFGGGFAMSHAALLSKKYEKVYYNELNPLVVDLLKKAIHGDFNYNTFKPVFIGKKEFDEKKDIDGYIKYIWSFSNAGKSYLFSQSIEPFKRSIHNFIVFGKKDKWFSERFSDASGYVKSKSIYARRMAWLFYLKKIKEKRIYKDMQQLERLERLHINCGSYAEYEYQDGDIVYCDPPYEGTTGYNNTKFNSDAFYDWCVSQPYKIYISSYSNVTNQSLSMICAFKKQNLMNCGGRQFDNYECIYVNKK